MRVLDLLLCEEIRLESGKLSLINVFHEGISVSFPNGEAAVWPQSLPRVCLFSRLQREPTDLQPDKYTVFVETNGLLTARCEGALNMRPDSTYFSIIYQINGFMLIGPGEITFAIELSRGDRMVTVDARLATRLTVTQ